VRLAARKRCSGPTRVASPPGGGASGRTSCISVRPRGCEGWISAAPPLLVTEGDRPKNPPPIIAETGDAPLPSPLALLRLDRVRARAWTTTPGLSLNGTPGRDVRPEIPAGIISALGPVAEGHDRRRDRASHHDDPPHLIEITALPLASHSRHRSRGAKSTMRSFGPSPRSDRAAGWISPSCLQKRTRQSRNHPV